MARAITVTRIALLAAFFFGTSAAASAETLMMPKRDARMNKAVVVWGLTTQPSTTACTLDFGDSTAVQNCAGADRSYKAYPHTYTSQGVFTATLTVGVEVATVEITVFDPALLPGGATGDANRSLGINMAIQDGLRHLWYSQANRSQFDTNSQAWWSGHYSETALVVLAFQNHGYKLPSAPAVQPTGLYEKYVVRRGLNHVITNLSAIGIANQTYGDPRAAGFGVAAGDSTALTAPNPAGYTSAIAMLPLAGSGALSRVNTEVAGYTNGKTYGEILQRLTNGLSFGQLENGTGRGSWYYHYNAGYHDGSTVGWDVLAFLAAEAAGVTVPGFVKTEFQIALNCHTKPDGSWNYGHYQTCTNTTSDYPTIEKGGIPLQGMAWTGNSAQAPAVINWINAVWNGGPTWSCPPNYGCGYAMFNNFKGLKLQGVTTLSNVNRSTRVWKFLGTTGVEDDWYADYQDYLVYTQNNPTSTTGGNWPGMRLSSGNVGGWGSSIAELILSPVALVLPDEIKFKTVGLTPPTNSAIEGGTHTVTAKAESTGGTPVPGATVNFTILSGPNAGLTGTGTTDSAGLATFTYTDAGPDGTTGTDKIRAKIGNLESNIVEMIWTPKNSAPTAGDDAYSTPEDTTLTVPVNGVLGNDNDPDSDPIVITQLTTTTNGTLTLNPDGSFSYTPNPDFNGTDSFTYKVTDDNAAASNVATVTITVTPVNDPPVAANDAASTNEDTPVTVGAPGTLGNDTDIDGGPLTAAIVSGPANGSVTLNADGSFTYTPNANFNGTDAFTYKANDGSADSNVATVTITVNPVNDPPVAANDAYTTAEDTPLTIVPPGVIVNDSDVDGNALTSAIVSPTSNGSIVLNPNGSFTYLPNANFYGTDTFTYLVNDGAANSNVATVTIVVTSVNDLPSCALAAPSIAQIWPPNHQLVNVGVNGVVDPVEGSSITITITAIRQDEPTNTQGDGNTPIDGYGVGTATAQVRAERSGTPRTPGDGRVYHISFTGTDADNGSCSGTVKVGVPHDQGQRRIPVDGGPIYSSTGS